MVGDTKLSHLLDFIMEKILAMVGHRALGIHIAGQSVVSNQTGFFNLRRQHAKGAIFLGIFGLGLILKKVFG